MKPVAAPHPVGGYASAGAPPAIRGVRTSLSASAGGRALPGTAADELAERAQTGDQRARAELCARYLHPLKNYFLTARCAPLDAEDATQHVLMRMLEALPSYVHTSTPFEVWLFTIARNHLVDRGRRTAPADAHDPAALTRLQEGRSAAETAPTREQPDSIRALIAPLTVEQQRVLLLIYLHDFKPSEVAHTLSRTEASVRQLHKRARDTLRAIVLAQSAP
jgi:RNA polymerase sigma factor (sigma-70 family)